MRQPSEHRSGLRGAYTLQRARLAQRVLAASIVAAFGHTPGLALAQQGGLPTGAQVEHGTAFLSTSGSQMTVENSRNAVLNWQSFSIGAANGVHFQQPDAASKVLNRVVGNDPSTILGSLTSNGEVWLVNPNGVLFGAGARIDVGALVASALPVSNDDFLAGRVRFGNSNGADAGLVTNHGQLSTSFGGRVWLVGGTVRNEGTIDTPGGQVVLAAGRSIELVDSGVPNVTVRVSAPHDEVVNLGSLLAPGGGSIDLHGAIVNQRGIVRADSIGAAGTGSVTMRARGGVQLAGGSITSADADGASTGGRVMIASDAGEVSVAGTVSADGAVAGGQVSISAGGTVSVTGDVSANGADRGGQVIGWGGQVSVTGNVSANGEYGGGRLAIGADGQVSIAGRVAATGIDGVIEIIARDVELDRALVQAGGAIRIDGRTSIDIVDTTLDAQATGNSMVLSTPAITASGTLLTTPNGRWLVRLDRISDLRQLPQLDQLGYTFVQVGVDGGIPLPAAGIGEHGVVVREALDVRIHVDADRVYDGSTRATISQALSSDLPTGLALVAPNAAHQANFADKHAGVGKPIDFQGAGPLFAVATATGQPVYGAGQAYVADVTRAPVTVAQVTAQDRVYDGTRGALLSGAVNGVLAGDSATLNGAQGLFDSKHAGNGKTVTGSGIRLAGPDGANYTVSIPELQASITPLALGNGALTVLDKVYDGTRNAIVSSAPKGIVDGDNVRLSAGATASFEDKNTGGDKRVAIAGAFLAGPDAANYLLGDAPTARASITPRRIDASSVTAQDKVYDGSRAASLNGTLAGLINGDSVRLEGVGLFDDRNVGADKAVAVSSASLAGADAGNYLLTAPQTVRAGITARPISAGALVVQDKVYDGTRAASVSGSLAGLVAGDNVHLSGATGLFADKNAGIDKTVTLSGGVLSGADARNYKLVGGAATGRATITPRAISTSALAAQDKVYDGTRVATLSGSLTGILGGDNVVLDSASGQFADKNAGVAKLVTIDSVALGGVDARNYTVSAPAGVRATIKPRELTLAGLAAQDKIYDGSRDAQVSATLADAVTGDAVSLEIAGQFDTRNAGSGKTVALTGTLRGADAANYALSMPASARAAITQRALDVVIDAAPRKEYDATTAIDLAPDAFALNGVVAGDALSVRGPAQGQFDSRDAGSDKRIVASGVFEILGADAANYRIGATALDSGSNRVETTASGARGAITPATLVYHARPGVVVGSVDIDGLGGTVTGFKGSDTLANATRGALQWHTTATPASAPGAHPIFGSGLSAANYVLVQAPGNVGALDIRAGLPAGGPLQRAQDGGALAIASALQAALPASCSMVRVWPQCDAAAESGSDR